MVSNQRAAKKQQDESRKAAIRERRERVDGIRSAGSVPADTAAESDGESGAASTPVRQQKRKR